MKTAIELVDEFPEQNPGNFEHDAALRLNDWGIEAHAMLRQQAEQIDSLKADAERYKWLRKNAVFGYCSSEGCNNDDVYLTVTGYTTFPESGETVDIALDEAIDAMRKS